jgi:hypothetical protein
MRNHGRSLFTLLLIGLLAVRAASEERPPPANSAPGAEAVRPHWKVGDRWIVETVTRMLPSGAAEAQALRSPAVQWQFTVAGVEKLNGRECFRVDVCCLQPATGPKSSLWIDRRAMCLRQVETQLPVPGGYQSFTESYEFVGDQPSAVLGPLTALPVDLPVFLSGQKGLQKSGYEAVAGAIGTKALGDVGFAFEVEQEAGQATPEEAKGLLSESFTKDLAARPAVEVRLKGVDRQVRQLWQAELPWPAYCDNGTTVSRLVKVTPAKSGSDEKTEK